VISLAPRPGNEVVTSERRRHNAWTCAGPADPLTYLQSLSAEARQLETVRGEGESRDLLETGTHTRLAEGKLNTMLTEPEWLNVLVERGEHKGYIIQADQVWFCNRVSGQRGTVFVDGDANMNNSRGRKRIFGNNFICSICNKITFIQPSAFVGLFKNLCTLVTII
jgi:hypothetical protein